MSRKTCASSYKVNSWRVSDVLVRIPNESEALTMAAAPVVYEVEVMFGDCDPAWIVFFPNFSKWMDASSLNFFVQRGVPTWRELFKIGRAHV